MGAALARAALKLGAKVTVVSGPVKVEPPPAARVIEVRTASQMRESLLSEFPAADICIMAAAVSDFRPANVNTQKIRRKEHEHLSLELESNPDILAELGRQKGSRLLVGFSLETGDGEASARRKMAENSCDLMILNNAEESLESSATRITIFTPGGSAESFPGMSKTEAADVIMQRIISLFH